MLSLGAAMLFLCDASTHFTQVDVFTTTSTRRPSPNDDSYPSCEGDFSQDNSLGSLRDWVVQFSIPLICLSALLSILRVHNPSLPKGARMVIAQN